MRRCLGGGAEQLGKDGHKAGWVQKSGLESLYRSLQSVAALTKADQGKPCRVLGNELYVDGERRQAIWDWGKDTFAPTNVKHLDCSGTVVKVEDKVSGAVTIIDDDNITLYEMENPLMPTAKPAVRTRFTRANLSLSLGSASSSIMAPTTHSDSLPSLAPPRQEIARRVCELISKLPETADSKAEMISMEEYKGELAKWRDSTPDGIEFLETPKDLKAFISKQRCTDAVYAKHGGHGCAPHVPARALTLTYSIGHHAAARVAHSRGGN